LLCVIRERVEPLDHCTGDERNRETGGGEGAERERERPPGERGERCHDVDDVLVSFLVFAVPLEVEIVQDAVGGELHLRPREAAGVQLLELSLALVVLVQIIALQGDATMQLIHIDREGCRSRDREREGNRVSDRHRVRESEREGDREGGKQSVRQRERVSERQLTDHS
jgi:hypothetical protein